MLSVKIVNVNTQVQRPQNGTIKQMNVFFLIDCTPCLFSYTFVQIASIAMDVCSLLIVTLNTNHLPLNSLFVFIDFFCTFPSVAASP